ncbi:MAG TPA: cation:proton antiporter [Candidatus Nanoarchaeia archaeon]|nr:cation:proton antiporter [Candidatus Nanoarchaeia archaeon]
MSSILSDIGIIIIVATALAFLIKLLKQPRIPAYILAGLLIGPLGLRLVTDTEVIRTLSEIGIAFMLFVVGMELDIHKLKLTGLVSSVGGILKSIILFCTGYAVAVAFGLLRLEASYIGLILAFSSTMVAIKMLADRKELETLHGRIIIGTLLIEDVVAILVLAGLTSLNDFHVDLLIFSLLKGMFLIVAGYLLGITVFPRIFKIAANSTELLFLMAISVCLSFVLLAGYFGFSIAIGAFVAGVALSHLSYNIEIVSRVKPLRDFFATIFFVTLGMGISTTNTPWGLFFALLGIVLLLKPALVVLIVALFGYKKKTGFLSAISLAQISEFALIIAAQGIALGHISSALLSLTVLIAVITIILTPYLVRYEYAIYALLDAPLSLVERLSSGKREISTQGKHQSDEVILIGYDRIGYRIYETLKRLKKHVLVIDSNPEVIHQLKKKRFHCLYGDIGDANFLEHFDFTKTKIIISTIPTKRENLLLTRVAKEQQPDIRIFATGYAIQDALQFYSLGADYVILPHFLGGDHVSLLLEEISKNPKILAARRTQHIKDLHKRKALGHEHPRRLFR